MRPAVVRLMSAISNAWRNASRRAEIEIIVHRRDLGKAAFGEGWILCV